jgi:predicted ester cyclase
MSSVEAVAPTVVVQTVYDRLNDHDVASLAAFEAEEVGQTWPVVGRLEGLKAVQHDFVGIFAAMPDFHIDIERMAADGETVFVHWHVTATFSGSPFLGIDATGRPIELWGNNWYAIRDGKIVAAFIAYDGMAFAVQAGILPAHGSRMDQAMTVAANWITRVRKILDRGAA